MAERELMFLKTKNELNTIYIFSEFNSEPVFFYMLLYSDAVMETEGLIRCKVNCKLSAYE